MYITVLTFVLISRKLMKLYCFKFDNRTILMLSKISSNNNHEDRVSIAGIKPCNYEHFYR